MSYRERLQALKKYRNEAHPTVSLYLNVTVPWELTSTINSLVRGKIKELRDDKSYSQEEREKLEKLLLKIEDQIVNREGSFKNTKLLVICADTLGNWEEFELPVSLPSNLWVEPAPHVNPLLVLDEQFPLFCVVVVDSHKAKMFSYSGGNMNERTDIFTEEEIKGARDEALKGLGEQRYERYIKDHKLRHIKQVADTIFDNFQAGGYDYLIIGGSDRGELNILQDNLHSYPKKRLVGEIQANPENSVDVIKKKVKELATEWERQREEEIVQNLFENAYNGGKAVLGTGPAIKALMNGQIHTLVVHPEAKKEGYFCPRDHYLSLKSQRCPVCGEQLEKSENIIEEIVEETAEQKGEVRHLFSYAHKIEDNEIGCLLRFVV
ncbi:MAG: hypothetical protein ACOC2B_04485 [Sediminispirochaetaceae bacterium]